MKRDLFELLREEVGCDYISDLVSKKYNEKAKQAFFKLDLSPYSMGEVCDLVMYLQRKPKKQS